MAIPKNALADIAAMPPRLRALLEAELAAGNEIAEVGHTFPAPPVGAYFKLAKPLLTRVPPADDGIRYYDRNSSLYSGEITDAQRFFFLLEPPHPREPEPDMDAIRRAHLPKDQPNLLGPVRRHKAISAPPRSTVPASPSSAPVEETAVQRFRNSMVIDYEKWHDGTGYDLKIIADASPTERREIERLLLSRGGQDWRDIEALAALDTAGTRRALKTALQTGNHEIRTAVTGYAPKLISATKRTASLLQALRTARLFGGLSPALDQVAEFHPPKIVAELFRGTLEREGDVAVHFAAMIFFIFGLAKEPFDWEQRPFFLRFNTENRREREAVMLELCAKIGPAADRFAAKLKAPAPRKPVASKPAPVVPVRPVFTVDMDFPGEKLIYREAARSATVTCHFAGGPRIIARTLHTWSHAGRRTSPMNAADKKETLARIADYCRNRHGLLTLRIET
jgi:hypothetical protein